MRDGSAVVRMEMTAASCKYEGAAQGSKTSGKLGNFVVVDLSREEGHFKEKLGLRDTSQSVVTFQSHRYVSGSEGYPGYDSMLVVEMSSTRFVYTRGFMEEVRQYISEEPLIGSIMGMTASAVAESAKKAAGHHRRGQGLMKVKCRLVNPLVVLPADEGREEALVADLGEILLENRFEAGGPEGRAEHFAVQVKAMNLKEAGGGFLMENVDVGLDGSRRLDALDISVLQASLAVSDVKVAFSCAQVELASRIWFQIVREADPEAPRTPSTLNESSTLGGEDQEEELFLEASDVEPWLQRREWQFGVRCTALVASVRESDPGSDRSEIARVRIAGVAFDGALTAGKSEGTLTVSAADIVDSCAPNSERLLLSSAHSPESSEAGPSTSSGHLATVRCSTDFI